MQDVAFGRPQRIADREDDYRKRRLARALSPARNDAFAMGDQTPDARVRTYADVMKDQQLAREKDNTLQARADAVIASSKHWASCAHIAFCSCYAPEPQCGALRNDFELEILMSAPCRRGMTLCWGCAGLQ
jgi:hypothetical protein